MWPTDNGGGGVLITTGLPFKTFMWSLQATEFDLKVQLCGSLFLPEHFAHKYVAQILKFIKNSEIKLELSW